MVGSWWLAKGRGEGAGRWGEKAGWLQGALRAGDELNDEPLCGFAPGVTGEAERGVGLGG